jgi:enediyne biosynthesis protein E4
MRVSFVAAFFGLVFAAGCPQKQVEVPKVETGLFTDVTAQAGLSFKHDAGATGRFYFVENTAPGGAFFDYDNDGYLDIFLVQSGAVVPPKGYKRSPCALFRNKRNGTFENVTAAAKLDRDLGYAQGVAVGDYDNDGWDDLFITAYGGNHLLRNEGGKFRDVTQKMGLNRQNDYATSAAWGDYDNDGRLDLYVCSYVKWTPQSDKPCRNDTTGQLDYCSPLLYDPAPDHLYRNTGRGFVDVSAKSGIAFKTGRGLAVSFCDYNGDGRQDIFVANDLSPNLLWRNNGDGTFRESAVEAGVALGDQGRAMAGMGIAVGDYDRSGRDSFFVTNFSERPNMLFRNIGHGVFQDATSDVSPENYHNHILSFGCEFFDYDADGWLDLITNNGHVEMLPEQRAIGVEYKQPKQLLRNESGGKFRMVSDVAQLGALAKPVLGRGLAVGDFDNDGRLDVLATNQDEAPQLLWNQSKSENHWLSLQLVGTKSNRDAVGARVKVKASGSWQTSSVRGGSSYLSSSDRRLYFGLGTATQADEVQILWPSGKKQSIKNLKADAFYKVIEGKAIETQKYN